MLKIGDKAPDFSGINQDGKEIKLSDYKGKKLVVYFYPKANTPGCTTESCNLRDNYQLLKSKGYEILGVSADPVDKQKSFQQKYSFPFSLLADTEKKVIQAYGAWGKKKFMGREFEGILRYTFLINEEGVITDIITKVKTKEHAEQILEDK